MLDRKLLLGTTVIAGIAAALAAATPATSWAQTAQAPAASTTKDDDETEVEALVVTGSRIKRTEFTSTAPIQVITAEQSSLEGLIDTSDILQGSSVASGSFQTNNQLTGFSTSGGPGVNTLSLRGLGSNRTLVLLNGRRAGPAGVRGQVQAFDLNVMPSSLIERVEILKDGASSIYGSDAIAGVVNIITKTNFDGFELAVTGNQSFDGGGERLQISGGWGKTFDRGYINAGFEYFNQEALLRGDREDTACAADYLTSQATGARLDLTDSNGDYICLNTNSNYVQTTTWGNLTPTMAGVVYPTAAQGNAGLVAATGLGSAIPAGYARWGRAGFPLTYGYTPQTENPFWDKSTILSPVERTTIALNGGFDITPNIEAYGEFLWNRRESSQMSAGQIFPSFASPLLTNSLPAAHGNNPFGQAVIPITGYPSETSQEVDYTRVVAGFRGELPILGGWDWDLYGQFSKSDGTYGFGERIYLDRLRATQTLVREPRDANNVPILPRINAAPGTTCINDPVGGNISNFSCSDIPGGIPWTSARILAGDFTQAERDFLFFKENGTTTYEHKFIEGSISGELFDLPAGPIGAAFGFQFRQEEINDTPGPQARAYNVALFTSAGITKGSDEIKEVFGELEVPLIKGIPGIEDLSLNLSGRYSDYESYGSSNTYKVGLNWQITPSWRIRATRGTSFRAPALYELYLGNQTSFLAQSQVDPCFQYEDQSDPILAANCQAAGVPTDYNGANTSSALILTGGGGPGILDAETSEATTIGVIWTPSFIDLSVAIDYFDIGVDDEVRSYGAFNTVAECYTAADYPTNPFCSLFTRNNLGGTPQTVANNNAISEIQNSYVNVASQINRGIDLTLRYQHEFDFGKFTFDGSYTWTLEDTTQLLASGSVEDFNGSTTEPDFTGNMSLRFDRGDWTAFWAVDLIGKQSDSELSGDTGTTTRSSSNCTLSQVTGPDPDGAGPLVAPRTSFTGLCTSFLSANGSLQTPGTPAPLLAGSTLTAIAVPTHVKRYDEFTAYHTFSLRYKMDDWTFQAGVQNAFDERPPAQSVGQSFRIGTAALNQYDMVGRRVFVTIAKRW